MLLPLAFSKLLAYLCKIMFLKQKALSLISFIIVPLVFSDVGPLQWLGVGPHSGLIGEYLYSETFFYI
jgi:hypothetical protein